jgi:cystathionine gamma-synthase
MRNLHTHPLCEPADLGSAIPPTPHGVSVCLPRWSDVIGYEEKKPAVIDQFRSGYPRFCCPPVISDLFRTAERELASDDERCLVFPRESHARRCLDYIAKAKQERLGRALSWRPEGFGVAVFPAAIYPAAREFWRFCGEVISTRQAAAALGKPAVDEPRPAAGSPPDPGAALRQRLAQLGGQQPEDVFLFPSGMAANYAVHRLVTSLHPGCLTAQLDFPYVDVLKLQQKLGPGAHFIPLLTEDEYEGSLAPLLASNQLAAVFAEAPSNPLLRCADLGRVREMLRRWQPRTPLVVDDTVATVVHVDAFRFADIVTTSLTKAFSGVGDVLAGCVILNRQSPLYEECSAFLRRESDHDLWRGDAIALERNSRDFPERVRKMSASAAELVASLTAHPAVAKVWESAGQGGAALRAILRDGANPTAPLLSLLLKNDGATSSGFYDRLRVSKGPSLGTNFTLACPYTLLAHYEELDWAAGCGVPANLIRVSVGLESPADLISRFHEAFAAG